MSDLRGQLGTMRDVTFGNATYGDAAFEHTPVKAASSEAMPFEHTPVKAASSEAMPFEHTPVKAASSEAMPFEHTPVKAASSEAMPFEHTLVEAPSSEATPFEHTLVEAASSDATPFEHTLVEAPSSEAMPLEAAPSEDSPIGLSDQHLGDEIVSAIYRQAESIFANVVRRRRHIEDWDDRIDSILTSRLLGYPLMLLLLGAVFWITVTGANYPSSILSELFFRFEGALTQVFEWFDPPQWLHGMIVQGVYRTSAWVVSVMLPPMAIFFPIFTFLEDLGYLPRVAFNLDHWFKRSGAHGKQALTMSMGFGCNAVGVMAARIIESPRERLIAILTNSFVPCNGRFPALIALATVFMTAAAGSLGRLLASATVVLMVLMGIGVTLLYRGSVAHAAQGRPVDFYAGATAL